ncbi:MAG: hypothetical protein ACQEQL_07685, partial [Pseudomonadota bacterium]
MNSIITRKFVTNLWGWALAFLVLMAVPAAAKTANLEIRVGEHGDYSRIVFDWNKMVAYKTDRQGDTLTLTFEAGAAQPFRVPSAHRQQQIDDINIVTQNDRRTVIEVDLADYANVRDYRLVRRVVVDVSKGSAPPAASSAQKPDVPKPTPKAIEEEEPEDTAAETPEDTPEDAPDTETETAAPETEQDSDTDIDEAEIIRAVEQAVAGLESQDSETPAEDPASEQAETEESEPADPPQTAPPEAESSINITPSPERQQSPVPVPDPDGDRLPTIITIATIEPTGIAVFDRFGYLWIVLESRQGTIVPERFGPLSNMLGTPEVLELEGGIAYRFRFPRGQNVSVRKEQLAWQIILTETDQTNFASAYIEPEMKKGLFSLVGHFEQINKLFTVTDPVVGDVLYIAPTRSATQSLQEPFVTPDLEILDTYLGFAALKKRDDISFSVDRDSIIMQAEDGMNISPPAARMSQIDPFEDKKADPGTPESRLFNLQSWRQGGLRSFSDNRYTLIEQLSRLPEGRDRTGALFQMALLYLANGFGVEALGLLDLVADADENIARQSSYLAVRGAAKALAGRYEQAIDDLGAPALQTHPEAKLWRGYAAAAAGQWRLAERMFPQDVRLLKEYPKKLSIPLTLFMAESALRSADAARAATLLEALDMMGEDLPVRYQAARHYLRGEMFRQNNQPEQALSEWAEAMEYRDRLYRTKARLAKVLLEWQTDMITAEEALEALEHMRFAWRDDGLEVQILHSIGLLRVVNDRYYDGLAQLQDAIRLAKGNREDTEPITNDMLRFFRELFVEGEAKNLPNLETITIFSEFQELMPSGEDGVTAVLNATDALVDMDLLERAAKGLEELLDKRAVQGEASSRVGARLAAVYLLDDEANEAISALQRTGRPELPSGLEEERQLLRARALSQMDMTTEAIEALSDLRSRNAQRLRADIYWRAGNWEEAADAFSRLLPRADVDSVSAEEAEYILNTAVALKLAGEERRLQAFKDEYEDLMQETDLAPSFTVVTREAGRTTLSDRETMLNIAEETD